MASSINLTEKEFPSGFKALNDLVEVKRELSKKTNPDKKISVREIAAEILFGQCNRKIKALRGNAIPSVECNNRKDTEDGKESQGENLDKSKKEAAA